MSVIAEYFFDVKLPTGVLRQTKKDVDSINLSFISLMTTVVTLGKLSSVSLHVFKNVVDEFAAFEHAMQSVRAVTNATDDDFKTLWNTARELGKSTRYSGVEVANALEELALLGLDAAESMEAIPKVLNLAATEGMNLKDAAMIAIGSMNAMNMGIEDIEAVNDALAYTATQTASTIYDLGAALRVVGSMASNTGQSLESILSVLGGMSNQMIKAENAGHAVGQMLARLVRAASNTVIPIDEIGNRLNTARQTIKDLGVQIVDTATGGMRPLVDILYDMHQAGMTTTQLLSIFGMYTVKAAASAINAAASIKQLHMELTSTEIAIKGTAERIAKMRMDSLQGELLLLTNRFKDFKIEIGEKVAPSLTLFYSVLNKVIEATTLWVAKNETAVSKILMFVGVFGALGTVATVVVGAIFALVAGGLPLILVLAGVVTASLELSTVWSKISGIVDENGNKISKFSDFIEALQKKYETLIDTLVIFKGVYEDSHKIMSKPPWAEAQPGRNLIDEELARIVKERSKNAPSSTVIKGPSEWFNDLWDKFKIWDKKTTKGWADHYRNRYSTVLDFHQRMDSLGMGLIDPFTRKVEEDSPFVQQARRAGVYKDDKPVKLFSDMNSLEAKTYESYYKLVDKLYDEVEDRTQKHLDVKTKLFIHEKDKQEQVFLMYKEMMEKTGEDPKKLQKEYEEMLALSEKALNRKTRMAALEMKKDPITDRLKYYESSMKMSKAEYEDRLKLLDLEMEEVKERITDETTLREIAAGKRLQIEQDSMNRLGGLQGQMYSEINKMTEGMYDFELEQINKKYELYEQFTNDVVALEEWKTEQILALDEKRAQSQGSAMDGVQLYYRKAKQEGWNWAKETQEAMSQWESGTASAFYNFFEGMRTDTKNWKKHLVNLFADMASAFAQAMQRMIAEYLAAKMIGMFLGMMTPTNVSTSAGGTAGNSSWGLPAGSHNPSPVGFITGNVDKRDRISIPDKNNGIEDARSHRNNITQHITIPISAMDSQDVDRALRKGGTSAIRKAIADGVIQSEGYAKMIRGK